MKHPLIQPLSRRQAIALLAGSAFLPNVLAADAPTTQPFTQPTTTRPTELTGEERASLKSACEALVAKAVRSGFGWGWADDEEGIDLTRQRPKKAKPPMIDGADTARIGLLLLRVGELLNIPEYIGAAFEAGRGCLAIQTRSGQIRGRGTMGAFGGLMDDPTDVPDRRPTRLAVILLMALIEADAAAGREADPRLRGPAQQAAHWLTKQQTTLGAWPVLYPPDAPRGEGQRLIRLDDTDLRDTALTVLLASEVLGDKLLRQRFDRCVGHLLDLRVSAGNPPVHSLWAGFYRPDGDPRPKKIDLLPSIDLLGTRHAAEVVLATWMFSDPPAPSRKLQADTSPIQAALVDLLPAVRVLKRDKQGALPRRYTFDLKPILPPPQPEPGPFEPAKPPPPPTPPHRMEELAATLDRLAAGHIDTLRADWQTLTPPRRRLALVAGEILPDAITAPLDSTETLRLRRPFGQLDAAVQAAWQAIGSRAL